MRFIGLVRQENRQSRLGIQLGRRVLTLTALSAVLSVSAQLVAASEGPNQSAPPADRQLVNSPLKPPPPDYSKSTDHELTRLGARWDSLSAPEREALLREVKLRMAQRKDADGVLVIRTQRRFGSVYSGNSRYLKIETKVIRVRPAGPGNGRNTAAGAGFGTGFEKRNSEPVKSPGPVETKPERPPLDAAMGPPVARASDPSS